VHIALDSGHVKPQTRDQDMTSARCIIVVCSAVIAAACGSDDRSQTASATAGLAVPQREFWTQLEALCGGAYQGVLTEGAPGDSLFRRATLVMHVRTCSASEIRIPFHAGDDHSRTWVITPTDSGLRLKHDHRHADGVADSITQYGGDTRGAGLATRQEFYADEFTASLIPAARTNVWTIELVPAEKFAYALRREGTDRRFRVEFDLTKPVAEPPPPWGASQ
jgi:hypothetical protein